MHVECVHQEVEDLEWYHGLAAKHEYVAYLDQEDTKCDLLEGAHRKHRLIEDLVK